MKIRTLTSLIGLAVIVTLPAGAVDINQQGVEIVAEAHKTEQLEENIQVYGDKRLSRLQEKILEGFDAFKSGEFAKAEAVFASALKQERNGRNGAHLVTLIFAAWDGSSGHKNSSTGFRRQVLPHYTQEEQAYLSTLYYMRGLSLAQLSETDRAKTFLRKAIKVHPKNLDARMEYALLELQSGNVKKAKKQIERTEKYMKKCVDQVAGDCDALQEKLDNVQLVYANTRVH